MILLWLPEAVEDLERLFEFLVEKSPDAAVRAIETIRGGAAQLEEFGDIGRPMAGDAGRRRELFIPFGAGKYVLRYRKHKETIVVIRVWHGRESSI